MASDNGMTTSGEKLRAAPDLELSVMRRICGLLERVDLEKQLRIVAWLSSRVQCEMVKADMRKAVNQ